MTTIECPWCDARLDAEALVHDGEARCDDCATLVELAPDGAEIAAAAAA